MYHSVSQFGELATVPTVGGSYKVASYALQFVDVVAVAFWALMQVFGSILIAAVHAAVAVVVHRAVANVVLVHQVNDIHNCLGVVGGVTVNLYIEDVTTAA